MDLLVAAASDPSGQSVRLIVVLLLTVALGLTGLTLWYWRFTDPRRRLEAAPEVESVAEVDFVADPEPSSELIDVALSPASSSIVSPDPAVTGQMPAVSVPPPVVSASDEVDGAGRDEILSLDGGAGPGGDPGDGPAEPTLCVPVDLELSVLSEATTTGEINLTDGQWDQLAEAVLDAIGWGTLTYDRAVDLAGSTDEPSTGTADESAAGSVEEAADETVDVSHSDRPLQAAEADGGHSVSVLD